MTQTQLGQKLALVWLNAEIGKDGRSPLKQLPKDWWRLHGATWMKVAKSA
jgi:hypothetical protein